MHNVVLVQVVLRLHGLELSASYLSCPACSNAAKEHHGHCKSPPQSFGYGLRFCKNDLHYQSTVDTVYQLETHLAA